MSMLGYSVLAIASLLGCAVVGWRTVGDNGWAAALVFVACEAVALALGAAFFFDVGISHRMMRGSGHRVVNGWNSLSPADRWQQRGAMGGVTLLAGACGGCLGIVLARRQAA